MSTKRSSCLNWTVTKKRILERAKVLRSHPFRIVSSENRDWLEAKINIEIDKIIQSNPSSGVTLYPPIRANEQLGKESI